MFKVGRWKNEKIKVVFGLQFQAVQVPSSKSKLMISVVPLDVGQPTVRLGKTAVQNGICTWENPVFEAVKFTREAKTGKLQDKIYQFIISTGSSKSGFLGEVQINLADYVDTTPSTICLPIKSSHAGAILQVTIHNMQGANDQRESQRDAEENGELVGNTYDRSLQNQFSNSESEGGSKYTTQEDENYSPTVSPDTKGRKSVASTGTLNSLFEQKQNKTLQETMGNQSPYKNNSVPQNINSVEKEHKAREPTSIDWSTEDDIANYLENTERNISREREQEPPKNLVEQLQREIFALNRQAEVRNIELQSLRRQVTKETKRGQELSGQVVKLKQERDALRMESEKLKWQRKGNNGVEHANEAGTETENSMPCPSEFEEGLNHAKDLNRAIRSKLRKTQDSNSELILVVRDLEEKLDNRERELANLSKNMQNEKRAEELYKEDSKNEIASDEEQEETPTPNRDFKEADALQQQITDLKNELEVHVKERRKLEEKIIQISQDYEIAKTENHDLSSKFNQKQLELIKKDRDCSYNILKVEGLESEMRRLENVIKKQAEEFSENSAMINDLNTHIAELEDELKATISVKVEQEQRALRAEENLRKTNLENASAAQRLQEEFRELSEELASKFEENEEVNVKAETQAKELRHHITILEERLLKATLEIELVQDLRATEVAKLSAQLTEKEREVEQQLLVHQDRSEQLSRSQKKIEDRCEALSNENQALRMEVERLTEENYYSMKQLEEMKAVVDETKMTLEHIKKDKDDLETKFASAITEIKENQGALKNLRSLEENVDETAGVKLQLEDLQAEHNQFKIRLSDTKSENDNLRKQLSKLKENLQKKDHEIALLEKLKDSSSKEISTLKEKVKQLKVVKPAGISPESGSKVEERKLTGKKPQPGKSLQNGSSRNSGESKRDTCTEKKVADCRTSELLAEVAKLKEMNQSMEAELKEMQEKYLDISLKFAEVEGERQQLVMNIRNLKNGQRK